MSCRCARRRWSCTTCSSAPASASPTGPAEQGRRIHVDAPPDLRVTIDPLRSRQALWNLVDNALRYGAGRHPPRGPRQPATRSRSTSATRAPASRRSWRRTRSSASRAATSARTRRRDGHRAGDRARDRRGPWRHRGNRRHRVERRDGAAARAGRGTCHELIPPLSCPSQLSAGNTEYMTQYTKILIAGIAGRRAQRGRQSGSRRPIGRRIRTRRSRSAQKRPGRAGRARGRQARARSFRSHTTTQVWPPGRSRSSSPAQRWRASRSGPATGSRHRGGLPGPRLPLAAGQGRGLRPRALSDITTNPGRWQGMTRRRKLLIGGASCSRSVPVEWATPRPAAMTTRT